MAITSKEINLAQLDDELGAQGLIANFEDKSKKLILPSEDSDVTEAQLEAAIAAHKAVTSADTATDKAALLDKLGISADEAKLLLS